MSTDLKYLAFTAILTASLWIPYIAAQVMANGFLSPQNYVDPTPRPVPLWGRPPPRSAPFSTRSPHPTDEADPHGPGEGLPVCAEPLVGRAMPLRADLFGVRVASHRAPRSPARHLARGPAHRSLPPVVRGRFRPGPLIPESPPNGYPETHRPRRLLVLRAPALGCVAEAQRAEGGACPGNGFGAGERAPAEHGPQCRAAGTRRGHSRHGRSRRGAGPGQLETRDLPLVERDFALARVWLDRMVAARLPAGLSAARVTTGRP